MNFNVLLSTYSTRFCILYNAHFVCQEDGGTDVEWTNTEIRLGNGHVNFKSLSAVYVCTSLSINVRNISFQGGLEIKNG
jgi:hypothetical protein